ncbi:MAG: HupE/UreJ family protein [Pseudomonadota bacterium]
MRALISLLTLCAAILAQPHQANAHALEPGYLQLEEIGSDNFRVFWRKPTVRGAPMAISVRLPDTCETASPPPSTFDGAAWVAQWIAACPGGLAGGTIAIPGLEKTRTDVLVRYESADGQGQAQRLTPDVASFVIPETPSLLDVIGGYFTLGVDHILEGIDHLLFVFALLLLIPDRWRLLGAVTAFTVAHSITMAAATLGWIALPGPPVEAVIALSIMFLASELAQRDGENKRLSERYPWIVSFSFGLLHGFGFAGALEEIGLPQGDVPLALLFFNLGVEAGQILFIGAVLLAGGLLLRLLPKAAQAIRSPESIVSGAMSYAIGGISAFWFLDRVAGF